MARRHLVHHLGARRFADSVLVWLRRGPGPLGEYLPDSLLASPSDDTPDGEGSDTPICLRPSQHVAGE
eukprot:15470114-Alexandrium_andersonii.AAC.1